MHALTLTYTCLPLRDTSFPAPPQQSPPVPPLPRGHSGGHTVGGGQTGTPALRPLGQAWWS